jgi:hypothetical protein
MSHAESPPRAHEREKWRRAQRFASWGVLSGRVGARPVPACACRRLQCVGALWGARAPHASRHGRGPAFWLYALRRGGGIAAPGCDACATLPQPPERAIRVRHAPTAAQQPQGGGLVGGEPLGCKQTERAKPPREDVQAATTAALSGAQVHHHLAHMASLGHGAESIWRRTHCVRELRQRRDHACGQHHRERVEVQQAVG